MTMIQPEPAGWCVGAPEPVGDTATLLARLRARAAGGPVAFGIDCPIGLPRAYAALHAAEADFPAFLRAWPSRPGFGDVASTLDEVSAARPFYPARGVAGMTRLSHALALGLAGAGDLCRACDRATPERPAGAPVFWTLGANQSGKAAIAAWAELIVPGLLGPAPPRLWPFEGDFCALLAGGGVVLAETYPAEALRHLGVVLLGSKRRQVDRVACVPALRAALARLGAVADAGAEAAMAAGFGADAAGEDRFDSLLGALCVLGVVTGARPDFVPEDPWIRRWEGWVLGQRYLN
jgi:hypothetical protein